MHRIDLCDTCSIYASSNITTKRKSERTFARGILSLVPIDGCGGIRRNVGREGRTASLGGEGISCGSLPRVCFRFRRPGSDVKTPGESSERKADPNSTRNSFGRVTKKIKGWKCPPCGTRLDDPILMPQHAASTEACQTHGVTGDTIFHIRICESFVRVFPMRCEMSAGVGSP